MAARRSWVVVVDDSRFQQPSHEFEGGYRPYEGKEEQQLVFFRESHADRAAAVLAQQNPGFDVHIYKQVRSYSSQPRDAELKKWTEDGHLVPATS